MSEIHINKDDIKSIIESYKRENNTFAIKSLIDKDSQKVCDFFLNGKECKIICYIKKKSVNIQPVGKNIDECNLLIKFIESKGFSTDIGVNQFVFPCTVKAVEDLIKYIAEECVGLVSHTQNCDINKFIGYNGDELTFTFYPQSCKAMIQGKPFHAYSIVVSYLSGLPEFSFDEIVELNNAMINMNTPSSSIRNEMQSKLLDAYSYLDEALLKSISGSITLLKQKTSSEDYTGCITGIFKALEGYLKKVLSQKYKYRFDRHNSFSMFRKEQGNPSKIMQDKNITPIIKDELNKLYSLYSNKRNVYLHSTVDPSQTRIIESLKEAHELSDDILSSIKTSYSIIFK